MNYDIFISYSRKDTAAADEICSVLDEQGISYFIDRKGISGGKEFPSLLADAILNSRIVLFIASKNSYVSKYTPKEITFALNEKPVGTILPYIIDNSNLPASLRLTFSDVNIRTIKEHPIKTVLIHDLCQLLGRPYKNKVKKNKDEESVPMNRFTNYIRWNAAASLSALFFLAVSFVVGYYYHSFWIGFSIFMGIGTIANLIIIGIGTGRLKQMLPAALHLTGIMLGLYIGLYYSSFLIGVGVVFVSSFLFWLLYMKYK